MTTTIIVKCPSDDEIPTQIEDESEQHHHFLGLPSSNTRPTIFKSFPQIIIHSIEDDRTEHLSHAPSASDFRHTKQLSFDITDDELEENYATNSNRKRSFDVGRTHLSPSDIRINLYPNKQFTASHIEIPTSIYENDLPDSQISLADTKAPKQNRVDYLRRAFLEHRFGRRIHSSFSSSSTIRSLNRRHSTQTFSQRFYRRQGNSLSRNSKWHFVRNHLHDIAMMNESYARMKLGERDLRWIHLREQISKQVLDMREMSILRQQDDGKVKKTKKTSIELKTIPFNEVVHVERDGRVYSIGTRDLVLGRLISDKDIQLDTFVQLDARRKFGIKQNLLRQQEGRNRLKKHIAFSFCLCNLSFIVLMFATMFIFAMKTIFELKSRHLS